MKIRRKKLFVIIPLLILIAVSIFNLSKPIKLPRPQKIIIYNQGNKKEIEKDNEYFSKIIELTDKCIKRKQSTAKDLVDDASIDTMRNNGLGIEFIYSGIHVMFSTSPFIYNKLYFQLGGSGSDDAFQHAIGTYSGSSRGPIVYSEELINTVHSVK